MINWRFEGGQLGHGSPDPHAGAMAALMVTSLVNEWLIRGLVVLSLASHLVLVLLAGSRRRRGPGVRTGLLWLAYQASSWAATHSLSNLTLGSTSREQQLVAFWTPFLLMHLGRPDNISAYSLQDNVLSGRQMLVVPAQVAGAIFVLYKHLIIGGGGAGTLLPASFLMFFLGIVKYVEGAFALWRGNLSSIRSAIKQLRIKAVSVRRDPLDNEQALLVAHELLHICKGAFADYSFRWNVPERSRRGRVFSENHGWEDMCRVVEMELSLMYDIMYTKATVVHTWHGYAVRVASPAFTAAALSLFSWSYGKDGQRAQDVAITYVLLVATFLLDVKWLLEALGSTWAYAFFNLKRGTRTRGRGSWWHGLRRFLEYTSTLLVRDKEDPTSYRMWSGTLGQYNLFTECTRDDATYSKGIAKMMGEDTWMEYQYSYSKGIVILPFVRGLLFQKIWKELKSAYPPPEDAKEDQEPPMPMPMPVPLPRPKDPDQAAAHERQEELDDALEFGQEIQKVIVIWHVATNVFLLCRSREAAASSFKHVKAIEELSNYVMFLVAVRPNMLPGLRLRSMHEATRDALKEVWTWSSDPEAAAAAAAAGSRTRDKKLARMLIAMEDRPGKNNGHGKSAPHEKSIILSSGTQYAQLMLGRLIGAEYFDHVMRMKPKSVSRFDHLMPGLASEGAPLKMEEMLERILDAWVRLLIHASTRCSRDSHANQLSRGGELTTVVWILAEHAGMFRIPQ